ncbi:MAG TPA: PAS domain-containing protein, partial [Nannocystaceae bacterium]|nr:PAS domain-containing protein [Nannocystaceae bacterium]
MRVDELLDQFADALMAVSPDGAILYWSRGAESLFGWSTEEAVGRVLLELVVPDDLREQAAREILDAVERGSATFEAPRRRKDGTIVHVDISMRAVR